MKWSWKIGAVSGITIQIHVTFLLILAWVAAGQWMLYQTVVGVVEGVLFLLALFACVVLHELGHALTAKRYGIATRDITLLPIGGVARLERMPERPHQEFWVAVAGPAVNVVIAGLLVVWLWARARFGNQPLGDLVLESFAGKLMIVNLFLVLFNMLPAFPMDGGRVLRAVLASWLGHLRATQIAAGVGKVMAVGFVVLAIVVLRNPFLILIAAFVWFGGSAEVRMAELRNAFDGMRVRDAMETSFIAVRPEDLLSDVVSWMVQTRQRDFPVIEEGRLLGVLTREDLAEALERDLHWQRVREWMRREFSTVEAEEKLEPAFMKLQRCPFRTLPVVRFGGLVGLISLDRIIAFMSGRSSLR